MALRNTEMLSAYNPPPASQTTSKSSEEAAENTVLRKFGSWRNLLRQRSLDSDVAQATIGHGEHHTGPIAVPTSVSRTLDRVAGRSRQRVARNELAGLAESLHDLLHGPADLERVDFRLHHQAQAGFVFSATLFLGDPSRLLFLERIGRAASVVVATRTRATKQCDGTLPLLGHPSLLHHARENLRVLKQLPAGTVVATGAGLRKALDLGFELLLTQPLLLIQRLSC